ncbi:hypothetical protein Taro_030798 [Colocasia esculenta]|uniref:tRNA pseudouridine synthase n=1 Tax=Colocasia esculenta TaxID=4460 RepID=A0A843VYZ5_COLES|nr:hypothetical protein [Colocasia esculenta]
MKVVGQPTSCKTSQFMAYSAAEAITIFDSLVWAIEIGQLVTIFSDALTIVNAINSSAVVVWSEGRNRRITLQLFANPRSPVLRVPYSVVVTGTAATLICHYGLPVSEAARWKAATQPRRRIALTRRPMSTTTIPTPAATSGGPRDLSGRESYQYMYRRPWQTVSDFYTQLVLGNSSLLSLFSGPTTATLATGAAAYESDDFDVPATASGGGHGDEGCETSGSAIPGLSKQRTGRWARTTFKIVVSYHGGSFDGWQKQPGLNTVQGVVEKALGRFVDEKKAQQLKERSLPVEGCTVVAGRTDKGVTALQQVCSFCKLVEKCSRYCYHVVVHLQRKRRLSVPVSAPALYIDLC